MTQRTQIYADIKFQICVRLRSLRIPRPLIHTLILWQQEKKKWKPSGNYSTFWMNYE